MCRRIKWKACTSSSRLRACGSLRVKVLKCLHSDHCLQGGSEPGLNWSAQVASRTGTLDLLINYFNHQQPSSGVLWYRRFCVLIKLQLNETLINVHWLLSCKVMVAMVLPRHKMCLCTAVTTYYWGMGVCKCGTCAYDVVYI